MYVVCGRNWRANFSEQKLPPCPLPIIFVRTGAVRKSNWHNASLASYYSALSSMRSLIPLSLLLTFLDLSANVNAAIFPVHARSSFSPAQLRSRASGSAYALQNITSLKDVQYITNLTVAGVPLYVSLDTGRFVKLILMNQLSSSKLPSSALIYG